MQLRNIDKRDSRAYSIKKAGKPATLSWWQQLNLGGAVLLGAMFALFICAIWAWVLIGQEMADPTPVPDAAAEEP
jgi:hypothetical protein